MSDLFYNPKAALALLAIVIGIAFSRGCVDGRWSHPRRR